MDDYDLYGDLGFVKPKPAPAPRAEPAASAPAASDPSAQATPQAPGSSAAPDPIPGVVSEVVGSPSGALVEYPAEYENNGPIVDYPADYELGEDEDLDAIAALGIGDELPVRSPTHDSDSQSSSDGEVAVFADVKASDAVASSAPAPAKSKGKGKGKVKKPVARLIRKDSAMYAGVPPAAPDHCDERAACCFILLGLPWWVSDGDLRAQAQTFGPVRAIRLFEASVTGKSTGAIFLEFATEDSARRARDRETGLASLPGLRAAPSFLDVSDLLYAEMRSGPIAWADGGAVTADLVEALPREVAVLLADKPALKLRPPKRPPSPMAASNGSDVCFRCRQPGHMQRNCPNQGMQQSRQRAPAAGSEEDHWSQRLAALSSPVNTGALHSSTVYGGPPHHHHHHPHHAAPMYGYPPVVHHHPGYFVHQPGAGPAPGPAQPAQSSMPAASGDGPALKKLKKEKKEKKEKKQKSRQ
mmetsp:Transcript_105217/g.241176  ORF Transcript_105217/g.241176 Transcript_105217/m.241176 type:complete len:470 (+) Transcript_105217:32-1441(+)